MYLPTWVLCVIQLWMAFIWEKTNKSPPWGLFAVFSFHFPFELRESLCALLNSSSQLTSEQDSCICTSRLVNHLQNAWKKTHDWVCLINETDSSFVLHKAVLQVTHRSIHYGSPGLEYLTSYAFISGFNQSPWLNKWVHRL